MKFKPYNNKHLYIYCICNFIPLVILLGGIGRYIEEKDISILLLGIVLIIINTLIYIIYRKLYIYKYVVDKQNLTKYKGKEIVFKIKVSDIDVIAVHRYYESIVGIIAFLLGDGLEWVTSFRICYKQCEIVKNNKNNYYFNLNKTQYKNHFQYGDELSYRMIKKLVKYLNVNKIKVSDI